MDVLSSPAHVTGSDRMPTTSPYPPGHPLRAQLRELLQDLGAASVKVTFENRGGQYRLLTYGTRPARHRLPEGATANLKAFAMAQLRRGLPGTPSHHGKRGDLSWDLRRDRLEVRY